MYFSHIDCNIFKGMVKLVQNKVIAAYFMPQNNNLLIVFAMLSMKINIMKKPLSQQYGMHIIIHSTLLVYTVLDFWTQYFQTAPVFSEHPIQ